MKSKRLIALLTALVLLFLLPSFAGADRYRILDYALSMLEEGNPFLMRYNSENHLDVKARYPLGCP